jgi:hypothetical protein
MRLVSFCKGSAVLSGRPGESSEVSVASFWTGSQQVPSWMEEDMKEAGQTSQGAHLSGAGSETSECHDLLVSCLLAAFVVLVLARFSVFAACLVYVLQACGRGLSWSAESSSKCRPLQFLRLLVCLGAALLGFASHGMGSFIAAWIISPWCDWLVHDMSPRSCSGVILAWCSSSGKSGWCSDRSSAQGPSRESGFNPLPQRKH